MTHHEVGHAFNERYIALHMSAPYCVLHISHSFNLLSNPLWKALFLLSPYYKWEDETEVK